MAQKKRVIFINPLPMDSIMHGSTLGIPYGPLYLSETLCKRGYEPFIVYTTNDQVVKKVKQLVTADTLCVGISTMSGTQLFNAVSIAKSLKKLYPDLLLIWEGVHITALPEQTLKSDLVDIVIWGKSENTPPVVLEAIEQKNVHSLTGMVGIGVKECQQCITGGNSGYTQLKDRVFELPHHLPDMPRHSRKLIISPVRECPIRTSRGCPYRCGFCSNSSKIWPNTIVRNHSIEHIVRDVSTLHHSYGADCITFADEGFLQTEKKVSRYSGSH